MSVPSGSDGMSEKVKPKLKRAPGCKQWEVIPPKGYRMTGTLYFDGSDRVVVGLKKCVKGADE